MSDVLPEYPKDVKSAADAAQIIELNPAAALQKAVAKFNKKNSTQYQLVSDETDVLTQDFMGANVSVRVQKAEDLTGKIPLYFGVVVEAWDDVYITDGLLDFVLWDAYKFPQK